MSVTHVSAELRRRVVARAENVCEYCLIHEDDTFFGCEVDHIISEKHGGLTDESNLALACLTCNRLKGSDIASIRPGTDVLVRFFHPRKHVWREHFALARDGVTIIALTDIGEATVRIFGLNAEERLLERQALSVAGRYPSEAARRRLSG